MFVFVFVLALVNVSLRVCVCTGLGKNKTYLTFRIYVPRSRLDFRNPQKTQTQHLVCFFQEEDEDCDESDESDESFARAKSGMSSLS